MQEFTQAMRLNSGSNYEKEGFEKRTYQVRERDTKAARYRAKVKLDPLMWVEDTVAKMNTLLQ